jgi:hypothetical protein
MATLRGQCEDYITLTYLSSRAERDEVIARHMSEYLRHGLVRQTKFFSENRPWQPIVKASSQDLNGTIPPRRPRVQGFVDVAQMARAMGLDSIYEFIYHATSETVHFSPHFLLRMGWGDKVHAVDQAAGNVWQFSTANFERYYTEFNRIYSLYMLLRLINVFIAEFADATQVSRLVAALEHENAEQLRWPELVTFEELNLDSPSPLVRIMMKVVATHDSAGADPASVEES